MTRRVLVNPIVHPSSILRGQWAKEPAQKTYLRRLAEVIYRGAPAPLVDINQPPPESTLFPSLGNMAEFRASLDNFDCLSIDIENAGQHIICVGMTQYNLVTDKVGASLCLRFRVRGGGLYWAQWGEHVAAVEWLGEILANPKWAKAFHNGVTYDVPIFEELGFEVRGRLIDTMILAHTVYSEFPKALQWTATLYLWAPVWKVLVDESEDDEGKT